MFMEVLDTTIANVALNNIAGSMSASYSQATWVLTSYLISNAAILPLTAWLGNRFQRKRLLLFCIFLFTVSSLLCGLSVSLEMLLVMRVFQGIGGGAMAPIPQAILMESFPPKKQGIAQALFGLGVVVAPVVGPILGGWLTFNYSCPLDLLHQHSYRSHRHACHPADRGRFSLCQTLETGPSRRSRPFRTVSYGSGVRKSRSTKGRKTTGSARSLSGSWLRLRSSG